jgi:hypothetical protein
MARGNCTRSFLGAEGVSATAASLFIQRKIARPIADFGTLALRGDNRQATSPLQVEVIGNQAEEGNRRLG